MSVDSLCAKFVELDRRMKYGFSKDLIANTFDMDSEQRAQLIATNGRTFTFEENVTRGMSMQAFIDLVQERMVSSGEEEVAYIARIVARMDEVASKSYNENLVQSMNDLTRLKEAERTLMAIKKLYNK